jgi:hypothetical protein
MPATPLPQMAVPTPACAAVSNLKYADATKRPGSTSHIHTLQSERRVQLLSICHHLLDRHEPRIVGRPRPVTEPSSSQFCSRSDTDGGVPLTVTPMRYLEAAVLLAAAMFS